MGRISSPPCPSAICYRNGCKDEAAKVQGFIGNWGLVDWKILPSTMICWPRSALLCHLQSWNVGGLYIAQVVLLRQRSVAAQQQSPLKFAWHEAVAASRNHLCRQLSFEQSSVAIQPWWRLLFTWTWLFLFVICGLDHSTLLFWSCDSMTVSFCIACLGYGTNYLSTRMPYPRLPPTQCMKSDYEQTNKHLKTMVPVYRCTTDHCPVVINTFVIV